MKILAIRFARLGDVILLLPALASLKSRFPGSELTLVTGHRCAAVGQLCPAVDHVISVDRIAMRDGPPWRALSEMTTLVRNIRRQRFDVVVDFHSFRETNLLTWLSGAPVRIGMKRYKAPYWGFCFNTTPVVEDKTVHVSTMFQRVASGVPPGHAASAQAPPYGQLLAAGEKADRPTIVFYIDAPVPERIWPPEHFAKVADHAVETLRAAVLVIASSDRPELAVRVRSASRNAGQFSILTQLELRELVRVIGSAHLLVSNDTGPMHIGPAVGVPTLGLFSVGYPEHFRPTGPRDQFLRANPIEQIQVREVIEKMEQMWATAGRGLQR